MGGRVLKVVIITVTFIAACGASWVVCSHIGHPHEQGSRWALCIGLGVVVAAAVQGAIKLEASARSRSTNVKGKGTRVAGPGAHHNAFGDGARVQGSAQGSGTPGPDSNGDKEADESTVVRGDQSRVAGAGSHDNAFGDNSSIE